MVKTPEAGVPRTGVTSVGEVARATFPVPVTPFSPRAPELLYSMSPFVPEVIVVEPTTRPLLLPPQPEPVPLTTPVLLPVGIGCRR